ncbi:MAG TPA: tRNA (5-methylaminomethyl-2-thiouridine)(34)-methyltransferase MnmD [Bacteroidia bacterium]|jgi:tRNA U34 5-methylaminomethyl-2-thiouridine-forming methyltransferase MnmC|nr:tRNA (5-methylaminomethyl-2-thiouridine)(34)-methyltransferase MnmD [Bacteroidia bacterium]HMU19033.1 tRNA (5-methylaminomethyl-2-thiouridine)(34)-methyltransferase MnmD [Bacteroidia bacterium]
MDSIEIVKTKEGIDTLINTQINEHYHSLHGAMQESMYVFIKNGLLALNKNLPDIKVLEMGFGTGLNAILTYRESYVLQKQIHYTTVESTPLPMTIIDKLNYSDYFGKTLLPMFQRMHYCNWFENVTFGDFVLHKINADMLELRLDGGYDLVYYDAFSPTHQPELWSFEVLHKVYESCNKGAILVTYCANGEVKRTLKKIGFTVETLPGPRGNREMIRACK